MIFPKDTREFVELLNSHGVKYVLLGGYAVAYHGHPRYTKDADFFVEASLENGARVARVINEFGLGSLAVTAQDVADGITVTMGRPPWRIDVIGAVDGIKFDDAWRTRIATILDGVPINVISRDLLIQNKVATGRSQDAADVEILRKRLDDE